MREQSAREELKNKEDLFKQKDKENEELKKRLQALESAVPPPAAKKPRPSTFVARAVGAHDPESAMILTSFKENVYPVWIFIGDEEEERQAMKLCLEHCPPIWRELENMPEEDQREQIKQYVKAYNPVQKVNEKRNAIQQKVREVWMEDYKNGKPVSGKMLLNVLKRPEDLIKLPEVDSKGQKIENKLLRTRKTPFASSVWWTSSICIWRGSLEKPLFLLRQGPNIPFPS